MTMVAAASVSLATAGPAAADDLELLNEWGSAGSAPGQFANPGDLQIAPSGNLVVSDSDNRRIQVFSPDGNLVSIIGTPGSGPGQFSRTSGIAIQDDGTMYVFDNGNGRVEVFDAAGTYVRQFLPPLDFYAGVALDPSQTSLYLVDYQGSIIDHVSTAGTVIGRYSGPGAGDGQLQRPQGIAVSPSGGVYVADRDNNRVEVFDVNGGFLSKFGSLGSGPGQLSGPWDVAVMPDQSILVTDANNFRLQHFDANGNFLASYDQVPASPNPDFRPIAVTAAPNGDIYMTDNTTHRILRARLGPAGATPVLGQSVTASTVSGTVLVRAEGWAELRAADRRGVDPSRLQRGHDQGPGRHDLSDQGRRDADRGVLRRPIPGAPGAAQRSHDAGAGGQGRSLHRRRPQRRSRARPAPVGVGEGSLQIEGASRRRDGPRHRVADGRKLQGHPFQG